MLEVDPEMDWRLDGQCLWKVGSAIEGGIGANLKKNSGEPAAE
jgi:hypothetical protein